MDIIESLLYESDLSDHEPIDDVGSSPAPAPPPSPPPTPSPHLIIVPPSTRAVARPRPPRPRNPSVDVLRARTEALELVVRSLPYVLRDLDIILPWTAMAFMAIDSDGTGMTAADRQDADRMRLFLKRTILLTKEAFKEIEIRAEYLRLLKCHLESSTNLRMLMRGLRLDAWFWMGERWRALTIIFYEPLSEDRCYAIMHETLHAIRTYKPPSGMTESDAFGWCDWVHLDDDSHYLQFMTSKTHSHGDIQQLMDHSWSVYKDGDLFKKAHLGDNCEYFLQILQQISPDVMIIQRVEKYPNLVQLTHTLALVFRVKTATGYMIVLRSIESPQLQRLMKAEGLSLSGNFFWESFDVAHRDTQDESDAIRFTLAGSIGSDNPTYAKHWRDELVIALVRYETQFMDKPFLPIEAIAEAASETPSEKKATRSGCL